ncbi:MAG: ATP-binding protein [Spirochaetales bacterium]|nr:ATP-binding protein [Spirochaetales bacterium]
MDKIFAQDESNPLFDKSNMFYKKFPSDQRQIRYFALVIVQKAPPEIQEINLLEQQISELLKNAVKHGNRNDPSRWVHVWYEFSTEEARLIVEDEGDGFTDLEAWNEFNRRRIECLQARDFETLDNYVSFRTPRSDEHDGGNALFAAVEYWNQIVFNQARNGIAVSKVFPKKSNSHLEPS